jgi:hypothetical protein
VRNRTYVAPISLGLGDLVVSLPAIEALIAEALENDEEAWLVARSGGQQALSRRIAGLAGSVDEQTFDLPNDARFVDLRDHPLQRDYWWGSPEFEAAFGQMSINDILARICLDFGIDADFSQPRPLAARPRPEVQGCVLLVTESDGPAKRWPGDRWVDLAVNIEALGQEVRFVTRLGASGVARPGGIREVCAPTPGDAIDLLTSCRAVVGVDTGLTHIAVQQATPTVTLCRTPPVYVRPWPHCRAVVGDRCDGACISAERDAAYNTLVSMRGFRWTPRACPAGSRCLASIDSDQVLSALKELL